jgi:MFS family permease
LFFLSLFGMSIALFVLSFNFLGQSNAAITIISLAAYLSFFSIGLGPGAWLIPSEIFSMSIRAKAMSLATFMNRLAATCMSSSFLSVANAMTWSGFFLMLAFVCILCLLFLYIYLPETRGRSLEDMTVYFAEITGDNTLLDADARLAQERVTPLSVPESDGNLGLT